MYNLNVCIVDRERSEAKVRKEKTMVTMVNLTQEENNNILTDRLNRSQSGIEDSASVPVFEITCVCVRSFMRVYLHKCACAHTVSTSVRACMHLTILTST